MYRIMCKSNEDGSEWCHANDISDHDMAQDIAADVRASWEGLVRVSIEPQEDYNSLWQQRWDDGDIDLY